MSPPLEQQRASGNPYDDLEALTTARCLELLGTAQIGRLAWCDEGRILVLPVNFVLDGDDVIIRSAAGAKLAAARRGRQFAFEVDDVEPALHTGWSVVLTGPGQLVTEEAEARRLAEMVHPWSRAERPNVVRITADQVTGRRVPLQAGGVTVMTLGDPRSRSGER
jgi:nitroimidazol reductase NimA-like FMN-containing flavoprotein (pyridoxamine 5'-phosphate oxidase superfamily)